MAAHDFKGLLNHAGHKIAVVWYGKKKPINVAIECEDCNLVLVDLHEDQHIEIVSENDDARGRDGTDPPPNAGGNKRRSRKP
jgi:hypothetical protein